MSLDERDLLYLITVAELQRLRDQFGESIRLQNLELLKFIENPQVIIHDPLRLMNLIGYLDQVETFLTEVRDKIAEFNKTLAGLE